MLYRAMNITPQHQQINFIDGSAVSVPAGGEVEIDEFKIYKAEFERAQKVFSMSQIAFKDIPARIVKGEKGNVSKKEE